MTDETSLNKAWGALRVVLRDAFSFYEIKEIAGLAGIDVTHLARLVQRAGGGASKGQLMTALDAEICQLDQSAKSRVLTHFAEVIVEQRSGQRERLDDYLEKLGWQFVDGRLIPIELFDVAELAELPDEARSDLVKAATRLRDGDLDGALASACAAVDSTTAAVYAEYQLISGRQDGFQTRFANALNRSFCADRLQVTLFIAVAGFLGVSLLATFAGSRPGGRSSAAGVALAVSAA